jgi:hypothetical protein
MIGACGSEQPGIWKRFQMPTKNVRFAISQLNSTVSALTAVRSQSTSTGLISRRQFSEIRLVCRRSRAMIDLVLSMTVWRAFWIGSCLKTPVLPR